MTLPRTAGDAVGDVLVHLERQAGRTSSEAGWGGLLRLPDPPLEALSALGPVSRLDNPALGDALPSLLLETDTGPVQIEFCPFGPLALLSSDGVADTDPPAQALFEAEIFPLFPADLDSMGDWHAYPLPRWLFPTRLRDALSLFETLRPAT